MAFILASFTLHFLVLVVLLDKPIEEPTETDFTEVIIKLGINHNYNQASKIVTKQRFAVAKTSYDSSKNSSEKTSYVEKSNSNKTRKIVQKKVIKKQAKAPENARVPLVKKTPKVIASKIAPSDKNAKRNLELSNAKPQGKNAKTQKKLTEKKLIKIIEKASTNIKISKDNKSKKPSAKQQSQLTSAKGSALGNNTQSTEQKAVDYESIVGLYIDRFRVYPQSARNANLEGTGKMFVKFDRKGNLLLYKISQSTGHTLLDNEMLRAVVLANPIKAFPEDYYPDQKTFSYEYPMRFIN